MTLQAEALSYSAMKLFSKHSNLKTYLIITDGQTDGQTDVIL